MHPLPRSFYERHPPLVAKELLGKVLISMSGGKRTSGKIVETEAYLGRGDPASRASHRKTPMNEIMWKRGGLAFIYMVHARWLFNITADSEGVPGAVLIRAVEPIDGLEIMRERRKGAGELELTSGPGKLTQAMGISRIHHGTDLCDPKNEITVIEGKPEPIRIASSFRIGVREDVKRKLRFFIAGNPYVSRAGQKSSPTT